MTVLLVGGDLRQVYLANRFATQATVFTYGLEQATNLSDKVEALTTLENLPSVDLLLLPMPLMENVTDINAPLTEKTITLSAVLSALHSPTKIFAGKLDGKTFDLFVRNGHLCVDLLSREELAVMNAVPTAEGTLQIMLEELPTTLSGLSVLLVGAGRISRVLRRNLKDLGSHVTVAARKASDLSWAAIDGCETLRISDLSHSAMTYDCVINTVPAMVLDQSVLSRIPPYTLLIDLASKPGGIDFALAGRLGLRTIWALSLPGKTAPYRAGEIIYQTICNQMDEWGETIC